MTKPKKPPPRTVRALDSVLPKPTLAQKIASLSVVQLQDAARGLNVRFDSGSTTAFEAVLNALEKRMSSPEFVKFCDELFATK